MGAGILLARPKPFYNECIVSYLIRVAEENGFNHIGILLHYAGLNWKNNRVPVHRILTGEFDIRPLFATLGLCAVKSSIEILIQDFRRKIDTPYLIVKYPKACPDCIREIGYSKCDWALLPVVACVKHKRILIDVSPKSGRRLGWYRPCLSRFDDGIEEIVRSNQTASQALIQQSSYFESFLSGKGFGGSVPAVLRDLGLRESLSLIHFIAHFQTRLSGGSFNPTALQNNELGQIYEDAWKTLMDWPDGFYALLSQYVDKPMSSRGKSGINKHFRDISERLYLQQANNGIARIKAEFDRYIEEYWPEVLAPDRITRIRLSSTPRNIISKKEAASILGCRLERIEKLVQQDRLKRVVFNGKAHYQRDQVEAFADLLVSNWTMAEACEALDITRYQLKQLLEDDVISSLQKPNRLNRDWIIDKSQCLSLMKALREKAICRDSLSGALSMAGVQRQGYSIVQLVLAMQAGEIDYELDVDVISEASFKQFICFRIR